MRAGRGRGRRARELAQCRYGDGEECRVKVGLRKGNAIEIGASARQGPLGPAPGRTIRHVRLATYAIRYVRAACASTCMRAAVRTRERPQQAPARAPQASSAVHQLRTRERHSRLKQVARVGERSVFISRAAPRCIGHGA